MSAAQPGAAVRFCGRDFGPAELERIRGLIAQGNTWRSQLARQVCQEFGWRNTQGRLKEMSCKVARLRMQRAGLLVLPAPRGRNGNGKKPALPQRLLALEPAPLTLPAHHLQALKLELVRTPLERLLYRQMMLQHHYLGYYPMPGAQLRYLLYHDGQLLGGLGFGASAWSLADSGSLHWLVEAPTPAKPAPGAQQSPLSIAALGAQPQPALPRAGRGVPPADGRLARAPRLPAGAAGNLRPMAPL
jgi:hypothetical protein